MWHCDVCGFWNSTRDSMCRMCDKLLSKDEKKPLTYLTKRLMMIREAEMRK